MDMGIDYFMLGDGSYKRHNLTRGDNNASTYTFVMVKVNHKHLYDFLFFQCECGTFELEEMLMLDRQGNCTQVAPLVGLLNIY